MKRSLLCACAVLMALEGRPADRPPVYVLDGPEVQPMREGLRRVGCSYSDLKSLDQRSLAGCKLLVLCGTRPPVDQASKPLVRRYVEGGGTVLATGGGAKCLIDLGLFDAEGYYMAGTTLHNTIFDGYHRLTFGYPAPDTGSQGTLAGVSSVLRATGGPLMKLGPLAASILGAGGDYSLAAIQRLGEGWILALGCDPQGGPFFAEVDKSRQMPGSQIKTDGLLANAVAFLLDPHCNLVPNGGFEDRADRAPAESHWEVVSRGQVKHEWLAEGAPEGKVYLKLVSSAKATAEVRPLRPIVVERGQPYRLDCQYRSTVAWKISWQWWKSPQAAERPEAGPVINLPDSPAWRRFSTQVTVPAHASYVRPVIHFTGPGELSLDDITLRLE